MDLGRSEPRLGRILVLLAPAVVAGDSHDHRRALRIGQNRLRGRAEQQAGEASATAGADDEDLGGVGGADEHLGGLTVEERPGDVEVREFLSQALFVL